MASSSPVRKKREKDRISYLPDAVLHHVLSFLDMKEVVQKSLVSRNWRYIWTSVPRLNFDHTLWRKVTWRKDKTKGKIKFMNFVDRVLFLRDGSIITRLNLSCDIYCDTDRVDIWLTIATRRRAKEIYLDWTPHALETPRKDLCPFIFDSALTVFSCRTTFVHLHMPGTMCLAPLLNTLHLTSVKLPQGDSKGELYLRCPVLENLTLINSVHGDLTVLNIHAIQLRNLIVENEYVDVSSCKIEICTPNLESLQLRGQLFKQYSLKDLFSLQTAELGFPCGWKYKVLDANLYANIIEGLCTAKTLELSGARWLIKPQDELGELSNPFMDLKYLKLTGLADVSFINTTWKLLSSSHQMETLVIQVNQAQEKDEWEHVLLPNVFPNLKDVTVGQFRGSESDLNFLRLLLKNAVVLRKLTITGGYDIYGRFQFAKFVRKIDSLPRASPSITIHVL